MDRLASALQKQADKPPLSDKYWECAHCLHLNWAQQGVCMTCGLGKHASSAIKAREKERVDELAQEQQTAQVAPPPTTTSEPRELDKHEITRDFCIWLHRNFDRILEMPEVFG